MNVLSTFDGMSCLRIVLDKLQIPVTNYFASEIDKYAIQVSKANWNDVQHIGDVTKVKAADLPRIDLLAGGSPCQGFSFAGKQLNFEDPRSKLFFEFVRLMGIVANYFKGADNHGMRTMIQVGLADDIKGFDANRRIYYVLENGFTYRKLTVTECKRLQTVPDQYKMPVSNTQAYKMLGNGWQIDTIEHLLEPLKYVL